MAIDYQFQEVWRNVEMLCKKEYGITIWRNTSFVAKQIFERGAGHPSFKYVECGVYKGESFIPIYYLCKSIFDNFEMYAVDSFEGFPVATRHPNDEFFVFEEQYRQGKISRYNFDQALGRCKKENRENHLTEEYFSGYAGRFFDMVKDKEEVVTVKGSFSDLNKTWPASAGHVDLVFLDCDLYGSYLDCLSFFENRTDCFIFDEYYSFKYPGARKACDTFFEKRPEWCMNCFKEDDPYFERWMGVRNTEK